MTSVPPRRPPDTSAWIDEQTSASSSATLPHEHEARTKKRVRGTGAENNEVLDEVPEASASKKARGAASAHFDLLEPASTSSVKTDSDATPLKRPHAGADSDPRKKMRIVANGDTSAGVVPIFVPDASAPATAASAPIERDVAFDAARDLYFDAEMPAEDFAQEFARYVADIARQPSNRSHRLQNIASMLDQIVDEHAFDSNFYAPVHAYRQLLAQHREALRAAGQFEAINSTNLHAASMRGLYSLCDDSEDESEREQFSDYAQVDCKYWLESIRDEAPALSPEVAAAHMRDVLTYLVNWSQHPMCPAIYDLYKQQQAALNIVPLHDTVLQNNVLEAELLIRCKKEDNWNEHLQARLHVVHANLLNIARKRPIETFASITNLQRDLVEFSDLQWQLMARIAANAEGRPLGATPPHSYLVAGRPVTMQTVIHQGVAAYVAQDRYGLMYAIIEGRRVMLERVNKQQAVNGQIGLRRFQKTVKRKDLIQTLRVGSATYVMRPTVTHGFNRKIPAMQSNGILGSRRIFDFLPSSSSPTAASSPLDALAQAAGNDRIRLFDYLAVGGCRSLRTLHNDNIVHGDVTAASLYLDAVDSVRLCAAGATQLGANHLGAKRIAKYVAPEVCQGEPAAAAADFWSLGWALCDAALPSTRLNPFAQISQEPASLHVQESAELIGHFARWQSLVCDPETMRVSTLNAVDAWREKPNNVSAADNDTIVKQLARFDLCFQELHKVGEGAVDTVLALTTLDANVRVQNAHGLAQRTSLVSDHVRTHIVPRLQQSDPKLFDDDAVFDALRIYGASVTYAAAHANLSPEE